MMNRDYLEQIALEHRRDTKYHEFSIIGNPLSMRYMTSREYFDQAAMSIATLGKDELIKRIKNFRGKFKLDFTDGYLNNASPDRLKHIYLAALISAGPDDKTNR